MIQGKAVTNHFLKEKTKREKIKKKAISFGDEASLPKGSGINARLRAGSVFMPNAFGSDI